jgi:hypothetical protein
LLHIICIKITIYVIYIYIIAVNPTKLTVVVASDLTDFVALLGPAIITLEDLDGSESILHPEDWMVDGDGSAESR